jgi:hypothetical protein
MKLSQRPRVVELRHGQSPIGGVSFPQTGTGQTSPSEIPRSERKFLNCNGSMRGRSLAGL